MTSSSGFFAPSGEPNPGQDYRVPSTMRGGVLSSETNRTRFIRYTTFIDTRTVSTLLFVVLVTPIQLLPDISRVRPDCGGLHEDQSHLGGHGRTHQG